MKKVLLFLFVFEVCYAQFIPHKASLTPSKDAVFSSETFNVIYSLTEVEGYIYIGLEYGYFETIGNDRWQGYIKMGETKTIIFTLKLKESSKAGIEEKVPLTIGFSRKPFGDRIIGGGHFKTVLITIIDFNEFKQEEKRILKDSTKSGDDSIQYLNLYPILYDTNTPRLRKEIILDSNYQKLE